MRPGDIVFTVAEENDDRATKFPRVLIKIGHWLKARMFSSGSPNVPVVHAAIAVDATHVVESVSGGIQLTDLTTDPRSAMVYTCFDAGLARAAAEAARQFYDNVALQQARGGYSVWEAFLSVFRFNPYQSGLTARINESVAISDLSFCSQFVANAYEVGNLFYNANIVPPPESVFYTRPSAITPWDLAFFCDSDQLFCLSGFWQDSQEESF